MNLGVIVLSMFGRRVLHLEINPNADVVRPEEPIRVVLRVGRVVGSILGGAGRDRVVVGGIPGAQPRQVQAKVEVGNVKQSAIVVAGGSPHVQI